MENDASVRRLVELIFNKQLKNSSEMTAQELSIPTCLITNEFFRRFQGVLCLKHMILSPQCQIYFDFLSKTTFSSHLSYLINVMYVSFIEQRSYQNIFESFLSVCAIVKLFNDKTYHTTGIDFRDFNADIFMVFYDNVMKRAFNKHGGFRQFVEYVRVHKYLAWKWNLKDLDSTDAFYSVVRSRIEDGIKKIAEEEIDCRDNPNPNPTKAYMTTVDGICDFLARRVLSTTSVELPTWPSNHNRMKRLVASRDKEADEKTEREAITKEFDIFVDLIVTRQGCSNSRTKQAVNQDEDNARYENIIQAVLRHNQSRSSGPTNAYNHTQMEAVGILEHLKDKIKSLLTVLDQP